MSEAGGRAAGARIAVGDIGGTHARFALANLSPGAAPLVEAPRVYDGADHADLASAWRTFVADSGARPADLAGVSLAVAGPVEGEVIKLTNGSWSFRRADLAGALDVARVLLLNDFGAMAWGISALAASEFDHVAGPDEPLPLEGVISVIGPGTGLGVAQLIRRDNRTFVIECEGDTPPSRRWTPSRTRCSRGYVSGLAAFRSSGSSPARGSRPSTAPWPAMARPRP